jgi:transposase
MRRIEPPSNERIKVLLEEGFSATAIARLYNVTPTTACVWVKKYKASQNG